MCYVAKVVNIPKPGPVQASFARISSGGISARILLPETVASGYCTFQKVAFDLKKLAEYDPQGTREFMESHGIQIADAPKQKPKNKSQRER